MSAAKRRRRQKARGKQTVPQSESTPISTSTSSFHVWDCKRMLQFQCPWSWGKLEPSPEADVRHCRECDRDVYLCRTPADFIAHGELARCVAIPDDLSSGMSMGNPSPEEVLRQKALADWGLAWWDDVLLRQAALDAEQIEAVREARRFVEVGASGYSPEHLAILRMAVQFGGVRCPQCGFDIARDAFGILLFLSTGQCEACHAPFELDLPSE